MAARKRPAPGDTVTARRVLPGGLARRRHLRPGDQACVPAPAGQHLPRWGVPPPRRGRAGLVPGPAGPTRCPCRDQASGSCPGAPSAAGQTPRSGTRRWPQQPSMAGPTRTCLTRPPGGRPTTSGSTPVRGGRPYPRRRQPGGRPGAAGMPGSERAPWPPSAI